MGEQTITIDLSAPARLADVPALARQFFDWWAGELLALLPARAKALLPNPRQTALLFARDDEWRIVSGSGDRAIELDSSGSDSAIAEQILQWAPDFALSKLTIVLPRSGVLIRRIELPLMSESSVRDAVVLQIDRLSPFTADAVRFATRVVRRDIIEGKLEAEIAFAPRASIEQLEARLNILGLKSVAVDIETPNGSPAGFDLRAALGNGASKRWTPLHGWLIAGAAMAWLAASYAWSAAGEGEIARWQQRIAELRPAAERSALLRRQFEGMAQPYELARAHQPTLPLDILAEVTRLLPDDARLTGMRISGETIELSGFASNAPTLISKLESSKLLANVRFRAPLTRRASGLQDRFEIALNLEDAKRVARAAQ